MKTLYLHLKKYVFARFWHILVLFLRRKIKFYSYIGIKKLQLEIVIGPKVRRLS
jgi:hypothetical protein